MRDTVLRVVFEVIDEVNDALPGEERLPKAEGTALFGDTGTLDSMAAVNLLLIAEERLTQTFNRPVNLTESMMLESTEGPPATVSDLVDGVVALLEATQDAG